jgi:uncharacterized protein RhaS with RHS repeats
MYDPKIGRFYSEDPLGFDAGDENLYRYVRNSPTNATDPSGMTEDDGGSGSGFDFDWRQMYDALKGEAGRIEEAKKPKGPEVVLLPMPMPKPGEDRGPLVISGPYVELPYDPNGVLKGTSLVCLQSVNGIAPITSIHLPLQFNTLTNFGDKKEPLTSEELKRLKDLLDKINKLNKAGRQPTVKEFREYEELLKRLKEAGVNNPTVDDIKTLKRILDGTKILLPARPMKALADLMRDLVKQAIGGLAKIDENKYQQYKRARDGGAPHDQAWTWREGGDTAELRYELEKLEEELKKK